MAATAPAATPTPVKTPAAAGRFGFGGAAATPAGTGTTPAPAPAPVTTPNAGAAPAPGTAAATAPVAAIDPPPLAYQSKTLEEILNEFQSELDRDALSFLSEAQRIAQYDAVLRDSQRSISTLTAEVSRLMIRQAELDRTLAGTGSHQRHLADTIDGLEVDVDEIFAAQSHVAPEDADLEREKAYALAIDLEKRLGGMTRALEGTGRDLEAAQERVLASGGSGFEGKGEIGNVLQILNNHHDALAYLEGAAGAVEGHVASVGRTLMGQESGL